MNKIIEELYTQRFHKSASDMLSKSLRIDVHEYRNFIDYDLIPFMKKFIEDNMEKGK